MKPSIPILIETPEFIAIDKPVGLSVHNEESSSSSVLKEMGHHLHLAHRLDKDTSGILLLAKTKAVAPALMAALNHDSTLKTYRALLRGAFAATDSTTTLIWNFPITDKAEGRQNPQGKAAGRLKAETEITLIGQNKYFSHVKATILTGRQHQIRKHAAIARHPVVGDPRYNDPKYNAKIFDLYQFNRMLLHAQNLRFRFQGMDFEIQSELPDLFLKLVPETTTLL